jgi:F0F1-type ATP synthase membrane subunit b/b'
MSGIFGGKPDTSGQEEQLRLQREQIAAQEKRTATKEAEQAKQLQASLRSRQRAGQRALLSTEREDAILGVGTEVV